MIKVGKKDINNSNLKLLNKILDNKSNIWITYIENINNKYENIKEKSEDINDR
jgi:hypothetical protein